MQVHNPNCKLVDLCQDCRNRIAEVKSMYYGRQISLNQADDELSVILDRLNEVVKRLSKKYNKRYYAYHARDIW